MDIGKKQDVAKREENGHTFQVRDEVGEKLWQEADPTQPVTMTVLGTYSSTYRRAMDAQRDRNIKQKKFALDGDELTKQALDLEAACITEWDGFTDGGQPFLCTRENKLAVLTAFPWIRAQVVEAMNDHAAFFPVPSPSSASV